MPEEIQPSQPSNEASNETPITRPLALINKSHVKGFALACGQQRAWKPTRVSQTFMDAVEANTRSFIERHVESHPSVGKTIQ
jgi:hypothetical protein